MSTAHDFFSEYTKALLARDADRIADLYAVPALILFPGSSTPVSDRAQTRDFFSSAMGQYDGVEVARPEIDVVAATDNSIWADVTWHYDPGAAPERNMYQLVLDGEKWRIAVLTPLLL